MKHILHVALDMVLGLPGLLELLFLDLFVHVYRICIRYAFRTLCVAGTFISGSFCACI